MGNQKGFAVIETLVALAILGVAGIALLSGLTTGIKATSITEERAIAESLVRSQIEYIESHAYVYYPSTYPLNPALAAPVGWALSSPVVSLVHASDDGLQQITVGAVHNGKTVLLVDVYKVNRN